MVSAHPVFIFLPMLVVASLALSLVRSGREHPLAEALIKAHVLTLAFTGIVTELLSFAGRLDFVGVVMAWLAGAVIIMPLAVRNRLNVAVALRAILTNPMPAVAWLLGVGVALLLGLTFVTGYLYPPNTWDGMTYHMPRVMHWIENGSISFYSTGLIRQNFQMPLPSFGVLHLHLLTGYDRFTYLVAWSSLVAAAGAVLLLGSIFRLALPARWASALILVSTPMALLQASGPQTDLVMAAPLMIFCWFMLTWRNGHCRKDVLWAGVALGAAVWAKGTALIYGLSMALPLAIELIWRTRKAASARNKVLAGLAVIGLLAGLFSAPHFFRNYRLYGHPLSPGAESYRVAEYSPGQFGRNLMRYHALHLVQPYEPLNQWLEGAIEDGVGRAIHKQEELIPGTRFNLKFQRHEDFAGNPGQMLLLLTGILSLPWTFRSLRGRGAVGYATGVLLCWLLYVAIMRWDPWASRLHTPVFMLAAPLAGMVAWPEKKLRWMRVSLLVLFLYGVTFALDNASRSLRAREWQSWGRIELYFRNRPYLFNDYMRAIPPALEFAGSRLGVYTGLDGYEYPIWILRRDFMEKGRKVPVLIPVADQHQENLPETILDIDVQPMAWAEALGYAPVYESRWIRVYRRAGTGFWDKHRGE